MELEIYPNNPRMSLSARIRNETSDVHDAAERSTFMTSLLRGDGELPVSTYLQLLAQYLPIYTALEQVAVSQRADPTIAALADPALDRQAAIEADLVALGGPSWADAVAVTPAASAYADRIRTVADWPGGFVAHHYVRYLGDLSGGQIIRRILRRRFGQTDDRGLSFYVFDGLVDGGVEFKKQYRQLLDSVPFDSDEADRVVAEARVAFSYNVEILDLLEPHLGSLAH